MGGDRQQRHVQTGDVRADGPAAGHEDLWMGIESGETDDDQVRREEYPRATGAQGGLELCGEQSGREVGEGLACSGSND